MKALIYTDLQATDGHEMSFLDANVPLQLMRVRKFYRDLHAVFEEHRCDCLWDLGDTTDDRSSLPVPAIDAVMEGLEPFPTHDLNIKLIGNHEQYLRDTTVHVGRMFRKTFRIVDRTDLIEFDDLYIACAAFPSTDGVLTDWLKHTGHKVHGRDSVLLGHFQVVGSLLNSGQAVTGIPAAALKPFSVTFLGHIHKPQKVGKSGFYVGSPFQQDFGERDEDKRVAVFDLDTFDITWVPLPGYPRYRVVDFDTWRKEASDKSEDRFQVLLANSDEAEAFYAHPLMGRAEPVYSFELPTEVAKAADAQKLWSREDVMRRYTERVPPGTRNIEIEPEELVELGLELVEAE